MQASKVLVVDGDRAARDALVTCLKFIGMDAYGAENAAAARSWLSTDIADVLVLSDELSDGAPADVVASGEGPTRPNASVLVLTRGGSMPAIPNYQIDDTLRRPMR